MEYVNEIEATCGDWIFKCWKRNASWNHRRLQAVYGENTVNRTTVNRWAIKFRECEPGRASIVDQPRSGRPISVTDDKHQKQVDELIKHDRRITQKQIAGRLGMSKERVSS